MHWPQETRKW